MRLLAFAVCAALLPNVATGAQAAFFDFGFDAVSDLVSARGTGSFQTVGDDGLFQLDTGIRNLTLSGSVTVAGESFFFNGAQFVDLLAIQLSQGRIVDLSGLFQTSGTVAGLPYGVQLNLTGLPPGNLNGGYSILGPFPVAGNITGRLDVSVTDPPPPPPPPPDPSNGFDILDGQISTSTLTLDGSGLVDDLSLNLFDLRHGYAGDLRFELSHGGMTVVFADLFGDRLTADGTSIDLNGDYVLADGVEPTLFQASLNGRLLAPGTYGTSNPLSAFNGMPVSGAWTLRITDNQKFDEGALGGWSLSFGANAAHVPEPATWAMLILGFGMIGSALRSSRLIVIA